MKSIRRAFDDANESITRSLKNILLVITDCSIAIIDKAESRSLAILLRRKDLMRFRVEKQSAFGLLFDMYCWGWSSVVFDVHFLSESEARER